MDYGRGVPEATPRLNGLPARQLCAGNADETRRRNWGRNGRDSGTSGADKATAAKRPGSLHSTPRGHCGYPTSSPVFMTCLRQRMNGSPANRAYG